MDAQTKEVVGGKVTSNGIREGDEENYKYFDNDESPNSESEPKCESDGSKGKKTDKLTRKGLNIQNT